MSNNTDNTYDVAASDASQQKIDDHEAEHRLLGSNTSTVARTTTLNTGTAATGVTAVHAGNGINNTVTLTLTDIPITLGTSGAFATGALIYTLPAGNITVRDSFMSAGLSGVTTTTDTPDIGLGTVVGSGAVAVLGGTTEFEDIQTGVTATDTNGTETIATSAAGLNILTGGAHTVYFNAADTWGLNADASGLLNGTVVLNYTYNQA